MKQAIANWTRTLPEELERAIGDAESVLDVGCGSASPLRLLKRRPKRLVGIDGFQPSIEKSRAQRIHDDYFCMDLLDIDRHFTAGSFECVVSIDVIEHFEKEQGWELLRKLETIASKRVVVFTPNGFLPQDEHSDNRLQRHRSGWSVEDFTRHGYTVIGMNGWKPLRGEFGRIRMRPTAAWLVVSRLTQYLVRSHPRHAFSLLAVKEVDTASS